VVSAKIQEHDIRRLVGSPGEGNRVVERVATLNEAFDRCLYFINSQVSDTVREALAVRRGCIVIAPKNASQAGEWGDCVVLEVDDPRTAIARVLHFIRSENLQQPLVAQGSIASSATISPLASIGERVVIGEEAVIEPFCVIDCDVMIGRGSTVRSGVRLHSRVSIGEESVIGSNSVVGHDGYGFVRDSIGNKVRIAHLGGVVIGSHVEIGPLTIVQSGVIAPTRIEDHAKVGDHIAVGHNVRIGRGASVTGGVMIGGGAVIESEAWIGLNATIREGRTVGTHALVGMDVSLQDDLGDDHKARAPRADIQPRPEGDRNSIGFPRKS
jgi:UDP-3-O-[3-hydroxymyristoyl] glucosamine N-acyltransferase